jgi:hypothetical protein
MIFKPLFTSTFKKMKDYRWVLFFFLLTLSSWSMAQTIHTQKLHEEHPDAFTLFFYKSTIRMLDPTNSEEYFNMIKGIEKAKFLRFDSLELSDDDLAQFKKEIMADSFEEGMTFRRSEGTANVFIRDKEGEKEGIIFIMKAEDEVYILDIVGKVAVSSLMELTKKMDSFKTSF